MMDYDDLYDIAAECKTAIESFQKDGDAEDTIENIDSSAFAGEPDFAIAAALDYASVNKSILNHMPLAKLRTATQQFEYIRHYAGLVNSYPA